MWPNTLVISVLIKSAESLLEPSCVVHACSNDGLSVRPTMDGGGGTKKQVAWLLQYCLYQLAYHWWNLMRLQFIWVRYSMCTAVIPPLCSMQRCLLSCGVRSDAWSDAGVPAWQFSHTILFIALQHMAWTIHIMSAGGGHVKPSRRPSVM